MSEDIYIDVNYLTESERDIILQVLAKDEELRKQEKRRISKLKNELDEIKKRGASEDEINSSRLCARCRVPLGIVVNSGALCPKCEARVCKECRKVNNSSWLCVLCAKIRDVRAESGAWFFEQERRKGDRPQLYGSALVRASFRRAKPSSQHKKEVGYFEPGSPPVIMRTSQRDDSSLHRPVPVHMSRLTEKEEVEEKESTEEINQNYKQYVKANRVPRKVEEVQSDACEKASSSSHSTTPRGSPVQDLENGVVEEPEETVFEHLVDKDDSGDEIEDEIDDQVNEHQMSQGNHHIHEHDAVNGHTEEEAQNYEEKVNNWEVDQEESTHDEGRANSETSVEIKSSWHEVAHEWAESGSDYDQSPAQDIHARKQFLNARPASPDSQTTGEFFTPLASPLHSGTGTPALSEHGQSEEGTASGSEIFVDAGDATPIEGDRTPVAEMSEEDDEANIGDVTIFNPEITCSTEPDDAAGLEGGHRTPTRDEDADSIDQAFANYEREHPTVGTKTIQEQLSIISMGSRESIVSYYSDTGEGRFGNITVTGEILFGLRFDRHKDQLEVQIHRAKDIAPADEKRKRSDPYVKVYLLPDKTRGGKRKTKVKRNTLEPDFDEILRFKLGFDEMLMRTLWLTMWNHDTFGHNDFLGEVMLPLDTYQDSGFSWDDPSPNWYPLRERRSEPSLMTYCGDLTVGLMFEPGTENHKDKKKKKKFGGKLHIKLKGARNLSAKDSNGFSDPFVKRNLPKLFDKNPTETQDAKLEAGSTVEEAPVIQEQVPLVSEASQSHENLAFEDEEKNLEPKDTSADSGASTMDTTLESTTSEGDQEVKNSAKESGNESGISESQVNGSDVMQEKVKPKEVHVDEHMDPDRDMKPVLKSISAFAMQFTVVNNPEITVEKPKTLFTVAKGDNTDAPTQPPRRNTEHDIRKDVLSKSSLSPLSAAFTKRRHSDFTVTAPISANEELAIEDLKRRGPNQVIRPETPRKGSVPDVVSISKGPQWSPRLERKRQDDAKKGKKKEERRKTLAELASEAGYKANIEDSPGDNPKALQETKGEPSKGSHESLLNEHGEDHYSSIPVTGELYVSLRYEMRSNKFEVHVHSANNLASADPKRGSSDPYIKTYLLPDKRSKRKTKTKKDTLNPKYDELLEYFIGYDELLTRTLHMSVWHKVIGRNVFLGEVRIPMNEFIEAHGNSLQQTIAKWFTLTDKSDVTDGLPSIPCELVLALKYVTADKLKNKKGRHKGELHVHLLEARNLPGMDADGMSDPYCKCYLLPDKKGKSKYQTPTIRRTLNPTFDYKFSYEEVSLDDLKERVLEITIYDFDRASSDEFMGGVRLGLGTSSNQWDDATEDECKIWQTMLSRSNVWIQVVVPLRSSMASKKNVES